MRARTGSFPAAASGSERKLAEEIVGLQDKLRRETDARTRLERALREAADTLEALNCGLEPLQKLFGAEPFQRLEQLQEKVRRFRQVARTPGCDGGETGPAASLDAP
jgi:hypothetical protein